MTASQVLAAVRALGVEVFPESGDRLRVRPASRLPAELKAALRQHKVAVLRLLHTPTPPAPPPAPVPPPEELAPPVPRPPVPVGELVERYRVVLARLWMLNLSAASRSPHAHQADLEDARTWLAEQARLCDELGPEFAAAVAREHAKTWATTMGACPYCGEAGPFHDVDTGEERAL